MRIQHRDRCRAGGTGHAGHQAKRKGRQQDEGVAVLFFMILPTFLISSRVTLLFNLNDHP